MSAGGCLSGTSRDCNAMPIPHLPILQPPGTSPSPLPSSGGGSGGGSSSPPPRPQPNCSFLRIEKGSSLKSRIEPQVAVFRGGNIQFKRSHEVLVPLWDIIDQAVNVSVPRDFYIGDGKQLFYGGISFDAVNFVWLKREGDNILFVLHSFMQDSDFYSLVRLQNLEDRVVFGPSYEFVTQASIVFSLLTNNVEGLLKYRGYQAAYTTEGWFSPCGGQYTITILGEYVRTFFSENIWIDPIHRNLYFFTLLRDLQDGGC